MQVGEFIVDRLMPQIVKSICDERGITFSTYSDDWVLEFTKGEMTRRVIGYKFGLNDAAASSISGDKVATHLILKRAGLLSVPHVLLRVRDTPVHMEEVAGWGQVVIKPLDGSGGHGVQLFETIQAALGFVETSELNAWAASPFIEVEREIRLVLLDGEPLIVYEKQPVVIRGLKMFNLGLGATPRDIVPDDELLGLAVRAQGALGLRLSAVDIVEAADGSRQVLEANSGFMMEHYARQSSEHRQRTVDAYAAIVGAVMR